MQRSKDTIAFLPTTKYHNQYISSRRFFSGEIIMQRGIHHFTFLFVILAIVLTSAVRTTVVHADDGVTEPPTAESTPPPVDEAPPTEEPAPATEAPAPAATEPAAVAEVLEQLPEDTALDVVNEAGEVEPLATVEAAEIV